MLRDMAHDDGRVALKRATEDGEGRRHRCLITKLSSSFLSYPADRKPTKAKT